MSIPAPEGAAVVVRHPHPQADHRTAILIARHRALNCPAASIKLGVFRTSTEEACAYVNASRGAMIERR